MNEMEWWLLFFQWQQALNKLQLKDASSQHTMENEPMLTFIKNNQKGQSQMSGKYIMINGQNVVVDSFQANEDGISIIFTINCTADGGASTGAIISLINNPSAVSIVDSDSNVTFTLNYGQISEYQYLTRENQAAVESFKLESSQIGVK